MISIQVMAPGEQIEFHDKKNRACVGVIEEVHVEKTRHYTSTMYIVATDYSDDCISVDGTTFYQI